MKVIHYFLTFGFLIYFRSWQFKVALSHTYFKIEQACSIFRGGLLYTPISDYYRLVLFFRRPITHSCFRLVQACSIFKRPIAHTHFRLLQACSIFKQFMHLHGSDWANRITITTTDAAATNDKFCSPFGDALYRAILSAGPAFNTGIVYIKF